jgi:hypothetical protein
MGIENRKGIWIATIPRWWRSGVLFFLMAAFAPVSLAPQQVDSATAEEVLVRAIRFMIEEELGSNHSDPILTGIRVGSTLRDTLGLVPSELSEAVSSALGIRIQNYEENTFCDVDLDPPYRRSRDADLRIRGTLREVGENSARVSVEYTGGTVLSGSTLRTVELRRTDHGWVATGLGDIVMTSSVVPCRASLPSLPPEELRDLLVAGSLNTLNQPSLIETPGQIEDICVDHRFDTKESGVFDATRAHLREMGFAVHQECLQRDGESGVQTVASPSGDPAVWLRFRSLAFDGEERIRLRVGAWSGAGPNECSRSPSRACAFNCSFERIGLEWGEPNCEPAQVSGGLLWWSPRVP